MSALVTVTITDVDGVELARSACDPTSEHWTFALHRAGVPAFVKSGERTLINLISSPALDTGELIKLHVRVSCGEEYARALLWLVATRAAWGLA